MAAMGTTQCKPALVSALKKPREVVPTTLAPVTPHNAFPVRFSNVVVQLRIEESDEYFENLKWNGASALVQNIFSMSLSRKHYADYIRSCTLRWLNCHGHTPITTHGLLNYLDVCRRRLHLHHETKVKALHMEGGERFNINYFYECTPSSNQNLSVVVEAYNSDRFKRASVIFPFRHLIDDEDELNGRDDMEIDDPMDG